MKDCFYLFSGAKTVIRKGALLFQKQSLTVSYVHEKNTYFTDSSPSDQKLEIGKEFLQLSKAHYAQEKDTFYF
jgi:hypothetical protein